MNNSNNDASLVFSVDNHIATIRLNRPEKRNAFTVAMIDDWVEMLQECQKNSDIRAIVLTGTGSSFCSGSDVEKMADPTQNTPLGRKEKLTEHIQLIPTLLEALDKPYIAAVNGSATGAGMDMALMADIRFVAQSARFAETYIRLGLVPGDGGAYFLSRLVGTAKALELMWTGDFIDAEEACRIGIANAVLPDDKLMDHTYEFAERIVKGPTLAVRYTKRAVMQAERQDLRTALDLISSHIGVLTSTDDHKEALQAFKEKRTPKFSGR